MTRPRLAEPSAANAISFYDAARNTTYVNLDRNILLSDNDEYNLTFAASFASGGAKVFAPKKVSFSFWSVSEQLAYAGGAQLLISVDDDLIHTAQVGPSAITRHPGGSVTEYLSVDVPYRVFARMSAGQHVAVLLGDRYAVLGQAQIETLRNMQRCVGQKVCA